VDGNDVIAVRVAVHEAIHKARACDSPTLIEALTYPLAEAIVAAADAVPVNDSTYVNFDVTTTPLDGAEAEKYAEARYSQMEEDAEIRFDLAEKVLAGEMTLEELPGDLQANTCFIIEDYATQVGQGGIRERGPEMLAQTDVKPILLRKIWLREIAAMLEGRAMKYWTIPIDPLTPITALIDVQC